MDKMPLVHTDFFDSGYKYMYDKYNDTYRFVPLNGDTDFVQGQILSQIHGSVHGFNRGQ